MPGYYSFSISISFSFVTPFTINELDHILTLLEPLKKYVDWVLDHDFMLRLSVIAKFGYKEKYSDQSIESIVEILRENKGPAFCFRSTFTLPTDEDLNGPWSFILSYESDPQIRIKSPLGKTIMIGVGDGDDLVQQFIEYGECLHRFVRLQDGGRLELRPGIWAEEAERK